MSDDLPDKAGHLIVDGEYRPFASDAEVEKSVTVQRGIVFFNGSPVGSLVKGERRPSARAIINNL